MQADLEIGIRSPFNADNVAQVQFTKPYYVPYITETSPMWLERKFECWERLPGADWASFKQINFE